MGGVWKGDPKEKGHMYTYGWFSRFSQESSQVSQVFSSLSRRLLRLPRTARRANQSILKETSLEYSLEELMLKLKLQYFGYLMRRIDSLVKTLMLEKTEGRRRRGQRRLRWLDGIIDLIDEFEQAPGVDDGQGSLACCCPWGRRVRHN